MGNDSSALPKPPSDGLPFFSITFSGTAVRDSLYINYCRESELSLVLQAAEETWPPGVKLHEPKVEFGYRIKLNGCPFENVLMSQSQSVWARDFLASMFLKLGRKGWVPYFPSDLRRFGDTTSIFMEYKPEAADVFLNSRSLAVVGLHDSEKLQLINLDGSLVQLIFDVVTATWHKKVSMKERETDKKNGFEPKAYHEIEMDGSPWGWTTNEAEAIYGRLTVLRIIENMKKQGWRLLLNCNVRPTTDTLFFVRDAAPAPSPIDGSATMFGMGLHKMDELRIVGRQENDITWQPQVVEALTTTINEYWPKGLKRSEQLKDFYVLEMHGTPWWADGTEAVHARLMVAKVLEQMLSLGWLVKSTIDCSRKDNDKNSFFFERCNPITTNVAVLSFNESDKIRSINCPKDVEELLDGAIRALWEVQRRREYGASNEWKLKGCPWDWGHWQNKALAIHLLYELNKKGYVVIASADTSAKFVHQENGPDYPLDVHSWFFISRDAHQKLELHSGGFHQPPVQEPFGPPPPYSYLAPSPNVTPSHSRSASPDHETNFSVPPPYTPQGVPQWGGSLYPQLH